MSLELEKLRVMIVDDNVHIQNLVRVIFKALGVENVQEALDGPTALAMLSGEEVDVVLVDWMMQPMDGIEFVRKVRQSENSPNRLVPIIMMTGHTTRENVTEARDVGVNDFIAKPLSAGLLYERVLQVIEKPRPFIKTEGYFGPDRRRRNMPVENNRRRVNLLQHEPTGDEDFVLSPEEIEDLFK